MVIGTVETNFMLCAVFDIQGYQKDTVLEEYVSCNLETATANNKIFVASKSYILKVIRVFHFKRSNVTYSRGR